MGICISAIGRLARRARPGDLFEAIAGAVEGEVRDPFDQALLSCTTEDGRLLVGLSPLSQPVTFELGSPGTLTVETKTSTLGPGYHAWVVDILKAVGVRCGIEWDWSEDETEFARDGDFAALQEAMSGFLGAFATSVLSHDPGGPVLINAGMGGERTLRTDFTLTPLGPRDRAWWERARRLRGTGEASRQFYPWWNRERDALDWRSIGEALMWSEVEWRPPGNEREEAVMRGALLALDRACTMDHSLGVFASEANELAMFLDLDGDGPTPVPAPTGIGYRRETVRRRAPGPWSLELPAYFGVHWDEEEGELRFFHARKSVCISTFEAGDDSGRNSTPVEEFRSMLPEVTDWIEFRSGGRRGCARIAWEEADGSGAWVLSGCMASAGESAIVLVIFDDEDQREWALGVWRSVEWDANAE